MSELKRYVMREGYSTNTFIRDINAPHPHEIMPLSDVCDLLNNLTEKVKLLEAEFEISQTEAKELGASLNERIHYGAKMYELEKECERLRLDAEFLPLSLDEQVLIIKHRNSRKMVTCDLVKTPHSLSLCSCTAGHYNPTIIDAQLTKEQPK